MTRRLGAVAAGAIAALMLIVPLVRAAESPVGTWDLNVEWPQGAAKVVMTVHEEGDGLAVSWEGPRGTLHGQVARLQGRRADLRAAHALAGRRRRGPAVRGAPSPGSTITGKLVTPANREIPASGTRRRRRRGDLAGRPCSPGLVVTLRAE